MSDSHCVAPSSTRSRFIRELLSFRAVETMQTILTTIAVMIDKMGTILYVIALPVNIKFILLKLQRFLINL